MAYKTFQEALDEAEKIISSALCLKHEPPGLPPDGKPSAREAKLFECPHCKALALIRQIRAENNP